MLFSKANQRISTLSIEAVRSCHSREYARRARNAAGEANHVAQLNVVWRACVNVGLYYIDNPSHAVAVLSSSPDMTWKSFWILTRH
jgi:hypothetical protein